MFGAVAKSIFGSSNDRYVKSIHKVVEEIATFEFAISAMSDEALAGQTMKFRARLGEGATLDDLLPEAFATVREVAKRTLGQRHFDVQMVGGIVLHRGEIAEMRTGEGKTLVATLATYLNALEGRGVHVVTVNDYLAGRDCEWMGQVYRFLGLTTGVIVPNLPEHERKAAYAADITYATNNELGFDYLRDNMKYERTQMVQRPFNFAIIDEVDSILIDEARTPLIISGPTDDKTDIYKSIDVLMKQLQPNDYEKDERQRSIILTEDGTERVERRLEDAGLLHGTNLYDFENTQIVHHVNQALRAIFMFRRDIDYIVKGGKVVIIDENTGRMMDGRRWSDGLHQAVEAKEGVAIEPENQTLASITFQNYFRLYPKLSGMTGTAATEAAEFYDIYKMNVVTIPTNMPIRRQDDEDLFYKSLEDKFKGIAKTIKEHHALGQPVLVGTVSIEKSELLSDYLTRAGVPHKVLNARFHEQEAPIVAQAGRLGAVTIATNMAGRGTDIQLGGNLESRVADELEGVPEGTDRTTAIERIREEIRDERQAVLDAGGLFVLGTERHDSRRIDNQLRGRSGRQGDPGLSRCYLSLDDDLLRIFGPDTLFARMMRSSIEDGEALPPSKWMSKAIETAQRKVEARNYDQRKQVVEYDDVMNDQRKVIYEQRGEIMDADIVDDVVTDMRHETINNIVGSACPPGTYPEQWDVAGFKAEVERVLDLTPDVDGWLRQDYVDPEIFVERLIAMSDSALSEKTAALEDATWTQIEKSILLQTLDHHWKEHLATLDALRQVIHLRAYAQKTPLNEYKQESFALFEAMLHSIRENVTTTVSHIRLRAEPPTAPPFPDLPNLLTSHIDPYTGEDDSNAIRSRESGFVTTAIPRGPTVELLPSEDYYPDMNMSRNARCPCGSGKKYKHCHGAFG